MSFIPSGNLLAVSVALSDVLRFKVVDVLPESFERLTFGGVKVMGICIDDGQNPPVVRQDDRLHLALPYPRSIAFGIVAIIVVRVEEVKDSAIF